MGVRKTLQIKELIFVFLWTRSLGEILKDSVAATSNQLQQLQKIIGCLFKGSTYFCTDSNLVLQQCNLEASQPGNPFGEA